MHQVDVSRHDPFNNFNGCPEIAWGVDSMETCTPLLWVNIPHGEYMRISSEHYPNLLFLVVFTYTSSTAQGGGGSFKNRKPIGEIGCCESGMAERSH